MNRGYTREWYMERIDSIRRIIPDCAISTDLICGFCDETEEEHQDTLSLLQAVKWEFAYMYKYSERPKTLAERRFDDNVSEEVKGRRLSEVIQLQMQNSHAANQKALGKVFKVLVEGTSKKSQEEMCGRNDQNTMIVFPKGDSKVGDYVMVKVKECTAATLIGEIVQSV
jgi:tRNA-2-methylthio-N6-dimethylallyladenosine synthase